MSELRDMLSARYSAFVQIELSDAQVNFLERHLTFDDDPRVTLTNWVQSVVDEELERWKGFNSEQEPQMQRYMEGGPE